MDTTLQAIRSVFFNWLGRACVIAISFVVTPILIHGLGDEAFGVWALVMSLGTYYALSNLGLRAAGVKYISQYEAVGDRDSVNRVVVTMLAAYVPIAAVVMLLAGGVALAFPFLIETENLSRGTVRGVILLTGASVAIGVVGQAFGATLAALKRFDLINALGVASQLIQAIAIIVAVRMGYGLVTMGCIVLLAVILRQLSIFIAALQITGYLSFSSEFFRWSTLRTLLSFGSLNVGAAAARRVVHSGGGIIIGVILGPVMVAFYAVAANLAAKVEDLAKGVNSVLMPVVSQLDAQNRRDELSETYFFAARSLMALGFAFATVFICLGRPLIALWIGPEYAVESFPVLCALGVAMAIRIPSTSASNVLKGLGRLSPLVKATLLEAALVVALGIVLVKSTGILGMGYAVLITECLVAGVLLPFIACRAVSVQVPSYLWKVVCPAILAGLPAVAVAMGMYALLPPSHLVHVILQAAALMVVTGLAILFICFDDQVRSRVLRQVMPAKLAFLSNARVEETPNE